MNDCEKYNRTNLKIIDNRNVVDIVMSQRYWEKSTTLCQALSNRSWNLVTKFKEKDQVAGVVLQTPPLIDCESVASNCSKGNFLSHSNKLLDAFKLSIYYCCTLFKHWKGMLVMFGSEVSFSLYPNHEELLHKMTEMISEYRHINKCLLMNFNSKD